MQLSIVIPAYNEELRIQKTLRTINDFLNKHKLETEMIIVNDGSTDNTAKVIEQYKLEKKHVKTVHLNKNQGKAVAVKSGVGCARGEHILITDADLSTPIEEYLKLQSFLNNDTNIVYASRAKNGAVLKSRQSFIRMLFGGKLAGLLLQSLLVWGIRDTQCGFKLIKTDTAHNLFNKLTTKNSALWDMELLILAAKNNIGVREIPVEWKHDNDTRLPYTTKYILNTIKETLRLKWLYKIICPLQVTVER